MIVTEDEAHKLACPFAENFNRIGADRSAACLGAQCMQWDWQEAEYIFPNALARKELVELGIEVPEEIKVPFSYRASEETVEQFAERKAQFERDYPDFNWWKTNDELMLAAGWELHPAYEKFKFTGGTQTPSRWRRLHPARKGQCGRTVIVSVERD